MASLALEQLPVTQTGHVYGAVSGRVHPCTYFNLGILLAVLAIAPTTVAYSSDEKQENGVDSTAKMCAGKLADNTRCPLHWVVVATYTHCCTVDVIDDMGTPIDVSSLQLISALNTAPANCCRNSTCPSQASQAQHGVFTCPLSEEVFLTEKMRKTPSMIRCCHTECCRPPNSTALSKAQVFGLAMLCSAVASAAAVVVAFVTYMMWKHEMACFKTIPAWCPVCLQPAEPKISPMKRTGRTIRMGPPPMKVHSNELSIPDVRWCYYPFAASRYDAARKQAARNAVMVRSYLPKRDVGKLPVLAANNIENGRELPFMKTEPVQPQYDT